MRDAISDTVDEDKIDQPNENAGIGMKSLRFAETPTRIPFTPRPRFYGRVNKPE
jgi:hypothetical protein